MPVRRVVYGEKNNRKTRLSLMRRERWSRFAVRPMVGTCLVLGLVTFVTVPVAADPPRPDATPAVTAQASVRVSVAPVPHLPGGSRVVGPAAATAQETGAVALTLPDETAVTQFIEETSDSDVARIPALPGGWPVRKRLRRQPGRDHGRGAATDS